jgi:hypothetical protein
MENTMQRAADATLYACFNPFISRSEQFHARIEQELLR